MQMQAETKDRWIKSLLRGLYMILFFIIIYIGWFLIAAIALFQFIASLIWKKPNKNLAVFGRALSFYAYEILSYITYNSEQKPYPFDTWPGQKKYPDNLS